MKWLTEWIPELWHTFWIWVFRLFVQREKEKRRDDWRDRRKRKRDERREKWRNR